MAKSMGCFRPAGPQAIEKRIQRLPHRFGLRLWDEIPLDVAQRKVQLAVVQLAQRLPLCGKRLNDGAVGIVDQYHDMRQLQLCTPANAQARRNARGDGPLRGADERVLPGR